MQDKWTFSFTHGEKSQYVLRIFCPRPGESLAVRHGRNWQRGHVWVALLVRLGNSWWRGKSDSVAGCQTQHKSRHHLPLLCCGSFLSPYFWAVGTVGVLYTLFMGCHYTCCEWLWAQPRILWQLQPTVGTSTGCHRTGMVEGDQLWPYEPGLVWKR